MKPTMKLTTFLVFALGLGVGTMPITYAVDPPISDEGPPIGQLVSQLGVPEPGSASDQEPTQKKRKPSKDQRAEQNAQMTLGGAKYFVTGEILKIDGDYHFVKDAESGDEVRLLVNKDTHKICGSGMTSASSSEATITKPEVRDPGASERQTSQGQRKDETAIGSGFQMGSQCSFKVGERVKAEVSDLGTVTTMRFLADTKPSSRMAQAPLVEESTGIHPNEATDKSPPVDKLISEKEHATAPADLRSGESHQRTASASKDSRSKEDMKGQLLRGRIIKIEDAFYTVKDSGGQEVRLHVDQSTQRGQVNLKDEEFKEGDRIEAYMTPKGHALSISLMRGQPNSPNDPEGGG